MIPRRGNYYFIASNAEKDCSKLDMVKDLGSFILLLLLGVSDLTTGLSTTDINACPKHIRSVHTSCKPFCEFKIIVFFNILTDNFKAFIDYYCLYEQNKYMLLQPVSDLRKIFL